VSNGEICPFPAVSTYHRPLTCTPLLLWY